MLAGGFLHTGAGQAQPFLLRVARLNTPFFQILDRVAVGCLVRQTGNRAGPEHMVMSEQFFHVVVRPILIFAGEVQIDIRHLVALKSQEDFKRNVKAVLRQLFPAFGAIPVRQIHPDMIPALVHVKESFMAVRTAVVRRQGVHFGNPAHPRHKA